MNPILEISRRSIMAYQEALNVTTNNINNASNENYVRQRVVMGQDPLSKNDDPYTGNGVTVDTIERVKNDIVESNILTYNSRYAYADKRKDWLQIVETAYTEPSDLGLSDAMKTFFNSWEELASNPVSAPLRTNVVFEAERLSDKFQQLHRALNETGVDLEEEARQKTIEVNNLLEQIRTLNKQVYQGQALGGDYNDLLDKRDSVIRDLSEIVNVSVAYDKSDIANVSVGGVFGVDMVFRNEFEILRKSNGDLVLQTVEDEQKVAVKSGEIAAIIDVYSNDLPKYQEDLIEIGQEIFQEVNKQHRAGFTNHTPPHTGIDFFSAFEGGVLKVAKNIVEDVNFIAVSADGHAGNNQNAKAIAGLFDQELVNGNTFAEAYHQSVTELGGEIELQEENTLSYELALNQLKEQRESISSVNVDEEWANVINFQRSYEASAKLIRIADELIQTVLGMVQ